MGCSGSGAPWFQTWKFESNFFKFDSILIVFDSNFNDENFNIYGIIVTLNKLDSNLLEFEKGNIFLLKKLKFL